MNPSKSKRIKILSKTEISQLYELPLFSHDEQEFYFSLSEKEFEYMKNRGSLESKVNFILQLGYFKATSLFFNHPFHHKHIKSYVKFILQKYFKNARLKVDKVALNTHHSNQVLIMQLLGYEPDKIVIKKKLLNMLLIKAQLCNNPVYLFHEALSYSNQYKFRLLAYSSLQDIITEVIVSEENRLSTLLNKHLNTPAWEMIENILTKDNEDYLLTALKKDPKSFKYTQIMGEIDKLQQHQALYQFAKKILVLLKLSPQNINYYSSLAIHYPIAKLKLLPSTTYALYVLCYVYQRFHKINDNLMVSAFHYIAKFRDKAAGHAQEYIFKEKLGITHDVKQAAIVLRFFDDESIDDKETFGSIRKRAYKYLKKGNFLRVSKYLEGALIDYQQVKWSEVAKLQPIITKNLRPIFNKLEFTGSDEQAPLVAALQFLKKYFNSSFHHRKKLLSELPLKCIPKSWINHIMTIKEKGDSTIENNSGKQTTDQSKLSQEIDKHSNHEIVDMAKYEFMVYQLASNQVEAGHLFLADSTSFKDFLDDLISDKAWRNKNTLFKKLGNKKLLASPDELLDQLESELEQLIQTVNNKMKNGTIQDLKITQNDNEIKFTLPYPESPDKANHKIYQQIPQVNIAEILQGAQQDCQFINAFTHIKPHNAKDKVDPTAIIGCIIANATNLGIHKMSETSDLNYKRMLSQMKNFIRLETLQEANDTISNAISQLAIFKHWDIRSNCIHGSVDGQKFETRLQSFMARYSSKYFGVNKGIVAYTLCANHVPVNTKIISANQHESHFLFDILFNNHSAIDISWLSGDGHSLNQINFTLLDFIEKQFAPHFKSFNRKTSRLFGFKGLDQYENLLIKPKHTVNKKLIKSEWDTIQRIIVSLLLGETSQHLIVGKLSSHKRKNKTQQALWEYDNILMSIYMLNYMSDPTIRQNVRRALNRGESYHQLRRAIADVHGSKFRGSSDQELEIWNECARLMSNCIIYYNAKLLNGLLSNLKKEGRHKEIEQLQHISPVAWRHVNFYGYYAFETQQQAPLNMANLIENISALGPII